MENQKLNIMNATLQIAVEKIEHLNKRVDDLLKEIMILKQVQYVQDQTLMEMYEKANK